MTRNLSENFMNHHNYSTPLATALLIFSNVATADFGFEKRIEDALKFGNGGEIKFDVNYRWENVDLDLGAKTPSGNYPKTANANTIRTRMGIFSPKFEGFQGFAEYEGTHALQDDYNDGRNRKPEFANTVTPAENELSQLWISYSGLPDTVIKGGRQTISFDDDRFIAPVLWQQLNVNFDAVLVTNKSVDDLTVNAAYIGKVQTFLSTTENINAPLLNVNYKVGDYGNLVGYGYWLDYTESENYFKSNQTYGLRFNGKSPALYEHYNLLYTAELGYQEDYSKAPKEYEAYRYNFMGGLNAYFLTVQGAVEQMNGAGINERFITPLGANHVFQGWSDTICLCAGLA
jgi:hypothetical protein